MLTTTPEARRGRSLVERLVARFPALFHLGARIVLQLPPESRLRGRLLWWAASRLYEGFNRRDWEMNMLAFDPEEYEFRAGDLGTALPGVAEVYRGREGYLEAMALFIEEWSEIRVRVERVISMGRDRVVTVVRFMGRGRVSGVPVENSTAAVVDFSEGRIVRQIYWWDCEAGLRWAGATAGEPRK